MPTPLRDKAVPRPPRLPEEVKSIVIVRLSARGDVMFATPIIRAMRRRWPNARLTWVVEPKSKDVVQDHPDLDDVIVWDRPTWKRLAAERRYGELRRVHGDFRRELRSLNADLSIDMQGLLRSGLVSWFTRAPIRISLGPQEGSGVLATHRFPTGRFIEEMSAEPKLMAGWLGLDTSEWALDLRIPDATRDGARARLKDAGVDGPFVLLVPFTTRPWKHWIERRWVELSRHLREDTGMHVVLAGGPADREAADRILSGDPEIVDLVGRTSLAEAVALTGEAALVVGVDTALTHAAHAFERPTVCVFGPQGYTRAPTAMSRMHCSRDLDCFPCKAADRPTVCGGAWTCMELIGVDEVRASAHELLAAYPA